MQSYTPYTYEECTQWMQHDIVNPRTNRSIEVGGDVYKSLYHSCGQLFGVVPASSYYYSEVLLQQIIDIEYKIGYLELELDNFKNYRYELVTELNKYLKVRLDPGKPILKLPDTAESFKQPADILKGHARGNVQGFGAPVPEIPGEPSYAIKAKQVKGGGATTGIAELDEMLKGQGITTTTEKDTTSKEVIAFSDTDGKYVSLSPGYSAQFKYTEYDLGKLPYQLKQIYDDNEYGSVLKDMADFKYYTVVQFVAVAKALFFDDKDNADKIYKARTTNEIYELEEQTNYDEELWKNYVDNFVFLATYFKFRNNDRLKKDLSKTGDKILVYAPGDGEDRYWSVGTTTIDDVYADPSEYSWDGDNEMGKVIMEVRKILKSQNKGGFSQKRKDFSRKKDKFSRKRSRSKF